MAETKDKFVRLSTLKIAYDALKASFNGKQDELTQGEGINIAEDGTISATATDEHINSLIDTKLGVIENGTY